jgi:N-acetylglutamate synthase-like GNAT family acetyltransferase
VPGVTPAPTARPAEGTDLAAARGIPSALTRWRLIAALGVLAFTALTVAQLVLGMNAASRAAADADQVIRIQDLKVDLLRADALATNAFLVGGLEPNAQRAAYDDALAGASTAITAAAEAQPADQAALAELSSLVLRYGSDMEVARANNRQGLPVGAAYLREASADDIGGILQLIEPFESDGTLVKRSRTEIERDIGHYTVIEHDGVIFGCAALYAYPESRTGELAALTVSPNVQGQGDGERILKRVEQRAKAMGLESIFVLTTRTMHWFIKRGFASVDPEWLPEARKRKYNWDRRSQVLVKKL